MELGDLLKNARERKGLSIDDMASALSLSLAEYEQVEQGQSDLEKWGPLLAKIAIELVIPTSRLVSKTGQFAQAREGGCGELIKQHREKRGYAEGEMAKSIGVSLEEYQGIERGGSPIERVGPMILHCAELLNIPAFSLLHSPQEDQ